MVLNRARTCHRRPLGPLMETSPANGIDRRKDSRKIWLPVWLGLVVIGLLLIAAYFVVPWLIERLD